MKFILLTKEVEMVDAAREGFHPSDELVHHTAWADALDACHEVDMIFVDLLSTLDEPNKIAGYERFAQAKMDHDLARGVPLVLIAPPDDYELDFMAGWPDFVFAHLRRPVTPKIFRRATTWV